MAETVANTGLSLGMIFNLYGWVKQLELPQILFKCIITLSILTWYLWIAAHIVSLSNRGRNLNYTFYFCWKSSIKETNSKGLWLWDLGTSIGVFSDVGVICICEQYLWLWIPKKDKLSIVYDIVVTTGILLKDKIGSIVGISSLKKAKSSLCHDKVIEKGSKVDDNGVRCDEVIEKGSIVDDNSVGCNEVMEKKLTVDNNGVRYDKATEKRSIVDDNGVKSTSLGRTNLGEIGSSLCLGFGMSSLGDIGSSLRCEGCLQCRWGTSKGSLTCFCIESSILL